VFHSPEGVALQEVDRLFSYCLVVSGYQIPSLSVAMIPSGYHSLSQHGAHYAVDQRLYNLRPVSEHVLQGPPEVRHHMRPSLG